MEPTSKIDLQGDRQGDDLSALTLATRGIVRAPIGPGGTPAEYKLLKSAESGIVNVQPHSSNTIDILKGDDVRLFTWGLGGCTSTLIATRDKEWNVRATMTHYGPMASGEHLDAIEAESKKHLADGREPTAISLLCVARGWFNPQFGSIVLSGNAVNEVNSIRRTVAKEFAGRPINFEVLPYDSLFHDGSRGAGFIVSWEKVAPGNAVFEAHDEYFGWIFPPVAL